VRKRGLKSLCTFDESIQRVANSWNGLGLSQLSWRNGPRFQADPCNEIDQAGFTVVWASGALAEGTVIMPSTAVFLTVTPLVPAGPSLADALAFYTGQLGFTVIWQGGSMAGVRRGSVEFNLVENDNRAWADNSSVSIGVDDLDALHREYRTIAAQVGQLELKAWGRREFHMIVPSGVCFQFYERETSVRPVDL
jgi:hypothetical protein